MSAPDSSVVFRTAARGLARRDLAGFARELNRRVLGSRGFCCLVTGDAELCVLNRNFRRKNAPTDVLSFPSDSADGPAGDIAISIDRAVSQAAEHGHSLAEEIRILMLHGALHLAGMDHERDRGQMARAEIRWRRSFGLPFGLIERGQQ